MQMAASNLTCMVAVWEFSLEAPDSMEQFWLFQHSGLGELQPLAWSRFQLQRHLFEVDPCIWP